MKTENLDGAPQRPQASLDQRRALVRNERGLHDGEICLQVFGGFIRGGRGLNASRGRFAGQSLKRRGEPGIDPDHSAPIGFILTMRVVDA